VQADIKISLLLNDHNIVVLHDWVYDSFWFEPLQVLVNDKTASASEIVRSSVS